MEGTAEGNLILLPNPCPKHEQATTSPVPGCSGRTMPNAALTFLGMPRDPQGAYKEVFRF